MGPNASDTATRLWSGLLLLLTTIYYWMDYWQMTLLTIYYWSEGLHPDRAPRRGPAAGPAHEMPAQGLRAALLSLLLLLLLITLLTHYYYHYYFIIIIITVISLISIINILLFVFLVLLLLFSVLCLLILLLLLLLLWLCAGIARRVSRGTNKTTVKLNNICIVSWFHQCRRPLGMVLA